MILARMMAVDDENDPAVTLTLLVKTAAAYESLVHKVDELPSSVHAECPSLRVALSELTSYLAKLRAARAQVEPTLDTAAESV